MLTDVQTLEKTFRDNYPKLLTLAFRMSGNREDSEDILQNSFLNALKGIENFRGASSMYTWLYRIVINCCRKYGKENLRLPVEEYADEHSLTQNEVYNEINRYGMVEEQALVNLTKENCLQMFMNCIPSKYRVIYTLRVILNFSIKKQQNFWKFSESLVKVNLHNARSLIAGHFEGRCSLMGIGQMCDCRSYAAFIQEEGYPRRFVDFTVNYEKEQRSVVEFYQEIKEILEIDDLYKSRIETVPYNHFMKGIHKMIEGKYLKLLTI